jgi:methyl-accepting chemotaxis protein
MSGVSEPSGHYGGTLERAAASAKQKARAVAEQQKSRAANRIGGVADAFGDAAKDLGREVPQVAEHMDDVSKRLIQTAAAFARRQPAVFFAGAVFTGFALSRFLKSSNPEVQR